MHHASGDQLVSLGEFQRTGPVVDRVPGIVNRMLPPYLSPEGVRVYVIDNFGALATRITPENLEQEMRLNYGSRIKRNEPQ